MDVADLWFRCKNPDCGYIPYKTKTEKVKKAWRYGESLQKSARQRLFLRKVEGLYHYKNYNHDRIEFECKHGMILLYEIEDTGELANSPMNPIDNVHLCGVCQRKIENEGLLYGHT